MAHGRPDWGITNGVFSTYQSSDMGELAARLGSPNTMDRRGDVVLIDSFEEYTGRYTVQPSGTGAGSRRTVQYAHRGSWCRELISGSDGGLFCGYIIGESAVYQAKVGIEVSFLHPSTIDGFEVQIIRFDGAQAHAFSLRYSETALALQYKDPAGVLQTVASGFSLPASVYDWSTIKLVADIAVDRYTRAVVNGVTYNLPASGPTPNADVRTPRMDFTVFVLGRAGFNDAAFIDDLILTQNEP
jgi:hypothetical protein